MLRNTTFIQSCLVLTCVLAGQGAAENLESIIPFEEKVMPQAKISGQMIVGLMVSGTQEVSEPTAQVLMPADWQGMSVCLKMASQDGLYQADGVYRVPEGWSGGVIGVPFQTTHASYLSATSTETFAVLVRQGDCQAPGDAVTPVYWNVSPDHEAKTVDLLVNSFGADEVYLILPDNREVNCELSTEANRLAFDFSCTLDLDGVHAGGVIEVNRLRRGISDTPYLLSLPGAGE